MVINHDADADAHANTAANTTTNKTTKATTREEGCPQADVAPSAGGGPKIPHPTVPRADLVDAVGMTVRDAEEEQELEAKVQDLSLGVYAPSSHALVIKVTYMVSGLELAALLLFLLSFEVLVVNS